ncbi:putative lipid II flippase FtsW [Paenibacillus macquariensis]|uniref:Probable peptidoglycan glycosyltransferase FtsW n=1 Tax=Paenibacillus macquariensis TaxID=948756 RepID=A0ABY1JL32_9BACL|nr:putative lipid II flippase FtsW [Paenibacillus macquariensis]MEC0090074.1 putative lipid II flippase FtsW [Paenibacillus macquariensis]OAB31046.1 stage V sporulation protein E [Paenibacillus macquariensis subsp. macquariensis]SIQ37198.1 cell division protein FtsW [Paenibacillus macquariensis]
MKENKPQPNKGTPDFQLLILTLLLVGFGLVMVYSSSIAIAYAKYNNDALYFTKRQFVSISIGIILMLIMMNIPYHKYKKLFIPFFVVTIVMLALVPYLGQLVNGARSWYRIGPLSIQPTEFAKLATILYLAALITKKGERLRDLKKGFIPVMMIAGGVAGLIMMQPDFGSCMILVGTCGLIIYAGGASMKHIMGSIGLFVLGAAIVLGMSSLIDSLSHSDTPTTTNQNYKKDRISVFLNPFEDEEGAGYNLIQSLTAIGQGGVTGSGFGKSIQKLHYLPNSYNDFIFAVIGEEFGFIGTAFFLLFYLYFIWRGVLISLRCPDPFGTLVGIGVMGLISIQAFINIGGVTQTIPLTGVTLPFISYGGSSTLVMLMSMGVLLSISRESNKPMKQEYIKSQKDYRATR